MPKLYLVMEIGCIECGLGSDVVGLFKDRAKAEREAAVCKKDFHWRFDGENHFDIFEIDTDRDLDRNFLTSPQPGLSLIHI